VHRPTAPTATPPTENAKSAVTLFLWPFRWRTNRKDGSPCEKARPELVVARARKPR
jgi:hypothetical protein